MSDAAFDLSVPPGLPFDERGSVVTVGTFDGVHRGHWAVLEEVRRRAERSGRRSVLVTFHPHPLRIVRPEAAPPLLTTPVEKMEILAESGLDYAAFLPFTPALARYSPLRFVEEILIGRFRLAELVIGYDHGFGRGRSGDVHTLQTIGRSLGFDVHIVPAVFDRDTPISSSSIRRALAAGHVRAAARALARPYSVRAVVARGEGRGRQLGFPTANLHVPDEAKLLPRQGIYAVRASLRDRYLDGVFHLGPRPTFPGSPPSAELHLFDFDEDLYGAAIRVDFCARLRDIVHFQRIDDLIAAIRADCDAARAVLASGRSACERAEEGLK